MEGGGRGVERSWLFRGQGRALSIGTCLWPWNALRYIPSSHFPNLIMRGLVFCVSDAVDFQTLFQKNTLEENYATGKKHLTKELFTLATDWPWATFLEDGFQHIYEFLGIEKLLAAKAVHFFIEVSNFHSSLNKKTQLLRQVRKQFL